MRLLEKILMKHGSIYIYNEHRPEVITGKWQPLSVFTHNGENFAAGGRLLCHKSIIS